MPLSAKSTIQVGFLLVVIASAVGLANLGVSAYRTFKPAPKPPTTAEIATEVASAVAVAISSTAPPAEIDDLREAIGDLADQIDALLYGLASVDVSDRVYRTTVVRWINLLAIELERHVPDLVMPPLPEQAPQRGLSLQDYFEQLRGRSIGSPEHEDTRP